MSDKSFEKSGAVQLAALAQPICIVAKSDANSIAAAAVLIAVLNAGDRRCCVQMMQQYNSAELEALMHQEYASFVLLDCSEPEYSKKLQGRAAFFVASAEVYGLACAFSSKARKHAFFYVAGFLGSYLEHGGRLFVPELALQDALQQHQLYSDKNIDMVELDYQFLSGLSVRNDPMLRKLVDVAEMLNACARVGEGQKVIASMLGDRRSRDDIIKNWIVFRRDITELLAWYERNKTKQAVIGNGYLIVHMKDYVAPHLAGSLAAQLARRSDIEENTFVLVLVHLPDSKLRVSLRMAGYREQIDMSKIITKIFENVSGEFGGNISAAGGVLSRADEERFITQAQKALEKAFVEEFVEQ